MAVPSSTPTASPIIALTTAGDSLAYVFPCDTIRWVLTTAATPAYTLQITQSTAVAPSGTTVGWPLVGTSTAGVFAGLPGSTVNLSPGGVIDYPIKQWVYGLTLVAITGGHIEVIKGAPGADWVVKKPPMNTTALA